MQRSLVLLRLTKWALSLVALAIALSLPLSMYRAIMWNSSGRGHGVSLQAGAITLGWRPAGWSATNQTSLPEPGWTIGEYGGNQWPKPIWWLRSAGNQHWQWIEVPIWMVFAPLAVIAGLFWKRDSRAEALAPRAPIRRARPPTWANVVISILTFVASFYGFVSLTTLWPLSHTGSLTETQAERDAALEQQSFIHNVFIFSAVVAALICAWLMFKMLRFRLVVIKSSDCQFCGRSLFENNSGICLKCGHPVPTWMSLTNRNRSFGEQAGYRAGAAVRDWLYPDLLRLPDDESRNEAYCEAGVKAKMGPSYGISVGVAFVLVIGIVVYSSVYLSPTGKAYVLNRAIPALGIMLIASWILIWKLSQKRYLNLLRHELVRRGILICVSCGYDLSGTSSGTCPECGTTISNTQPTG